MTVRGGRRRGDVTDAVGMWPTREGCHWRRDDAPQGCGQHRGDAASCRKNVHESARTPLQPRGCSPELRGCHGRCKNVAGTNADAPAAAAMDEDVASSGEQLPLDSYLRRRWGNQARLEHGMGKRWGEKWGSGPYIGTQDWALGPSGAGTPSPQSVGSQSHGQKAWLGYKPERGRLPNRNCV
jgi:hypothetical protein